MNELTIKAVIVILLTLCLSCSTEIVYRDQLCYDKCLEYGMYVDMSTNECKCFGFIERDQALPFFQL